MLIYSNNRYHNDTLFGDVNYKSAHDPEHSINRTCVFKRGTHRKRQQQQQQNKRSQAKYKQNRKKLTVRNIKFLKSLGLQVKRKK